MIIYARVINEVQHGANAANHAWPRYFREGVLRATADASDKETAWYVFGVLGRKVPRSLRVRTDKL